jgi:ABC-type phosphate transport system permease subunit
MKTLILLKIGFVLGFLAAMYITRYNVELKITEEIREQI